MLSRADLTVPLSYQIDLEAEIADRRYEHALSQITCWDVLAITCDILSEWEDYRTHPLAQLATHVMKYGSEKRSGRPPHFGDRLSRDLENIIDEAIERCVCDQMLSDEQADLALDME